MMILKARVRLFFHCLFRFHRSYHAWSSGEGYEYLGCECGASFYGDRKAFDELMAFMKDTQQDTSK